MNQIVFPNYDKEAISKRLTALITEKFGSRDKFAEYINESPNTVNSHCKPNGNAPEIKGENLLKYASALGVSVDYLLTGKDFQPKESGQNFERVIDSFICLVDYFGINSVKYINPSFGGDDFLLGKGVNLQMINTPLAKFASEYSKLLDQKDLLVGLNVFDLAVQKKKEEAMDYFKILTDKKKKNEEEYEDSLKNPIEATGFSTSVEFKY